jgi:hypothetical protein
MPLYEFYNSDTDEYFEDILSISEKERLLKLNPNIRSVPSKFGIISGVGDVHSKTDDTWKEVLSKVAEAHPNSTVGERYQKKTAKEIKTQEILNKHRKKWNNT